MLYIFLGLFFLYKIKAFTSSSSLRHLSENIISRDKASYLRIQVQGCIKFANFGMGSSKFQSAPNLASNAIIVHTHWWTNRQIHEQFLKHFSGQPLIFIVLILIKLERISSHRTSNLLFEIFFNGHGFFIFFPE